MRYHNLLLQAVLVWQAAAGSGFPRSDARSTTDCHVLPTDALWPSVDAWQALNATVNGHLVASAPLGGPCHDPNYNATACAAVQQQWQLPEFQYVLYLAFLAASVHALLPLPLRSNRKLCLIREESASGWLTNLRLETPR